MTRSRPPRRMSVPMASSRTRNPCHFTKAQSRSTPSADSSSRCTSVPILGWSRPFTNRALADNGISGRAGGRPVPGPRLESSTEYNRSLVSAKRSCPSAAAGASEQITAAIWFARSTWCLTDVASSPPTERRARRASEPRWRAITSWASAGSNGPRSTEARSSKRRRSSRPDVTSCS